MQKLKLIIIGKFFLISSLGHAAIVPLGSGSYTTTLPAGRKVPSDVDGNPVKPKITADFKKNITTHEWWSSIIWQNDPKNPYSQNTFVLPLCVRAQAKGLDIGYSTIPAVNPDTVTGNGWKAQEYHYNFVKDLTVGLNNLSSADTKVADYSDWTVTAEWKDEYRTLRVTMGKGMPFLYCTTSPGDSASITCANAPTIWYHQKETIGLSVNGKHYGIFAPRGSTWQGQTTLISNLNGKQYFSVALLPDNKVSTLLFFQKRAYAFVTDTLVEWDYNEATAQLTTTYTAYTQLKENFDGAVNEPLMALFRHQWLHSPVKTTAFSYISPRGQMKLMNGSRFTTQMTFNGILPILPLVAQNGVDTYSSTTLYSYVDTVFKQTYANRWGNLNYEETYWIGKQLGKIAQLLLIADQVKHTQARDLFLKELKEKLQVWYTATTTDYRLFYYDNLWQSLIGYPAGFGSDTSLSDHHFHYGYFIIASAIVALYDRTWTDNTKWGAMVELLIRDAQNWNRLDPLFPFLRHFDIYEGHGWANGAAKFVAGNDQESSSESINCSAGIFLWGMANAKADIRDLGIYLYLTEAAAIKDYWFDVDEVVFPDKYIKPTVAILWGNGGAYAIWWSGTVQEVHGINFTPITSAMLYVGHYPDYLKKNHDYMLTNNSQPNTWIDIHMGVKAMYDPLGAITTFNNNKSYTVERGETKAHTYHWIHNMNALGLVDPTTTANTHSYAVFNKNGKRTYVAYNPIGEPITVTFSDGKQLIVPAHSLAHSTGAPTPPPSPTGPVGDFIQKIVPDTLTVQFTPTSPATFVDLHYLVNGINQQNVRMLLEDGIWSWKITDIKDNDVITYFFTYTKDGLAYDSQWFTYTV